MLSADTQARCRSLVEERDEFVSAYTRARAFEDGELVDVSKTAREAGVTVPVAVTATVYERLVRLPPMYRGCQDPQGRLWDVIWMAAYAARNNPGESCIQYTVWVRDIRKDGRDSQRHPRRHHPILAIGAGDAGEPVMTIMFSEDE